MQPILLLTGMLLVDVPLDVDASVSPAVISSALEEVDRLFAEGGIRFRFRATPSESARAVAVSVHVRTRPRVRVVTGCRRNLHDHRLGRTELRARRITLWTEQVTRAVEGNWDAEHVPQPDDRVFATALGRVLAHELGHLFLRLDGHREDGLMRSSFSYRALRAKRDRPFRLSREDLERVRRGILLSLAPS